LLLSSSGRVITRRPLALHAERSCQFVLAQQFLQACATGASRDCCDVVADQWRLSSSAPFSACFCQPSFWQVRCLRLHSSATAPASRLAPWADLAPQASVEYMQQFGVGLADTLQRCIDDFDKQIVFRGGPLTWCPAAAA
jgi:hypothetical protein